MTRWTKIAVCAGVGVSVVAVAAGMAHAAGPDGWIGRRVRLARLMRELQVSPSQARDLRAAAVHLRVERKALDLEELPAAQQKERLFQLRREFFARAEEVLNDEQKSKLRQKWATSREARTEKLRQKATEIADKLQLTPEQRQQARQVIDDTRTHVAASMAETQVDEPTRLARAAGELEETRGRLYRLLTPAQKEKAKGLIERGINAHLPQNPLDASEQ
jgi:hypothetical protein